MDLTQVHTGVAKRKPKKRVGRGVGSGHGKTASRGHKGQYASAGAQMFRATFEGGQTPFFRRVPKRGFTNGTWTKEYAVVNVGQLDKIFADGDSVTIETLKEKGLFNRAADGVRILGDGNLTKRLTIRAHHFSKSALAKIQAAGGTADLIPPPKKPVRNKMKPRPPKAQA